MTITDTITDRKLLPIGGPGGTTEVLGGISKTTVYELVKQGLLTKVNIGTRGFITAESVATYVESLKPEPATSESLKPAPQDSRC